MLTWASGELRALRRGDETSSIAGNSDTDYHGDSRAVPSPVQQEKNKRRTGCFSGDRRLANSVDGAARESPSSVCTTDGQKSTSAWWEGECIRTIVKRRAEGDFVLDLATEA